MQALRVQQCEVFTSWRHGSGLPRCPTSSRRHTGRDRLVRDAGAPCATRGATSWYSVRRRYGGGISSVLCLVWGDRPLRTCQADGVSVCRTLYLRDRTVHFVQYCNVNAKRRALRDISAYEYSTRTVRKVRTHTRVNLPVTGTCVLELQRSRAVPGRTRTKYVQHSPVRLRI